MAFTYRPREPHKTALYETVRDYLNEFLEICRVNGKTLLGAAAHGDGRS